MPSIRQANSRNISRVLKGIRDRFDRAADSKEMRRLGDKAAEMIRIRTRLGYGVPRDDAKRRKLKSLQPTTIEQRILLSQRGLMSQFTRPRRSNLTATGQLLDSLQTIKARGKQVIIGPKGSRWDTDLTNPEVSEFVSRQGRPYLHLTALEVKKLARFYQNEIVKPKLPRV